MFLDCALRCFRMIQTFAYPSRSCWALSIQLKRHYIQRWYIFCNWTLECFDMMRLKILECFTSSLLERATVGTPGRLDFPPTEIWLPSKDRGVIVSFGYTEGVRRKYLIVRSLTWNVFHEFWPKFLWNGVIVRLGLSWSLGFCFEFWGTKPWEN